ncbi:DUF4815 domain-containing protein [Ancylobacter sp. G4_0304]|uniref:DUF4815 domain-containing protein n=1 Tax=Ancylobacter sp. G4_0304 TaxID=3114289 RepID=UPI0039C61B94
MAFEHPSNLPGAYDRHGHAGMDFASVVFREARFLTGADHNEAQSILRSRARRLGDMVARDGDRTAGAAVAVDVEAKRITLAAGMIYAVGDVRAVAERIIEVDSLDGDISIGIRIHTTYPTDDDVPELRGLEPGTLAEGEPAAAREVQTVTWSLLTLDEPGDYYQVYLCRGGTVLDQTAPSNLSQINQQIAAYDRGATGGNYVVRGCAVSAIGQVGATMQFSIAEGEANIYGYKRTRGSALRYAEPLAWDSVVVAAEPHTFDDAGSGSATIALNNGPIDTVSSILVTKQVTETLTRGTPANTADPLGQSGATTIVSVSQGGSPIASGWVLSGNAVNWAGAGPEPAVGSSYQVTYRYLDAVLPSTMTADTVTVAGGVTGSQVIVGYSYKLPRIDRICLNQFGEVVYLRGVSKRRPRPPIEPETLLGLADVYNDWRGTPAIDNNAINAAHFAQFWRLWRSHIDLQDLVALERLKSDIDAREPVAKRGMFVDPLIDDTYRDAGEPQTAAVFGGSIQLAIDITLHPISMTGPVMLDYVPELAISQPIYTACEKINPYAVFAPLPAILSVEPNVDFWTETRTDWTSPETRSIAGDSDRTTVTDELLGRRTEDLQFLRQITVAFTIRGFGPGETLEALVFDGLVLTPPGLVADASGVVTGSFVIPANVVAGSKDVIVVGGSGATAWCEFVGQGEIDITTMRRVTTIETAPPVVVATPAPVPDTPAAEETLPQNIVRAVRERRTQRDRVKGDPQAQSFVLDEARHILGVTFRMCAIGDRANGLMVDLVTMDNGDPTTDAQASVAIPMTGVDAGELVSAAWKMPIFTRGDDWRAFVIKTDDNEHSISVANLGEFDAVNQRWVSANPYTIGNRHSSSNAVSWDHHNGSDITFNLFVARFTAPTRTVVLGTVDLLDCSDLQIRATVEIPTAECALWFEVVRAGGAVIQLQPHETHEFTEYVTETVTIRAVLRGSEKVSPTLYPGVTVAAGKLRASGTYVTRAMELGTAIRHTTRIKTLLPAGSAVTVQIDKTDGIWAALPVGTDEVLPTGWRERSYTVDPITAFEGRIKLTLTGTPAARPALSDLRCVMI